MDDTRSQRTGATAFGARVCPTLGFQGRAAAELVREAVAEYTARASERQWPRSIGMGDSGDPHFAERYEDYLDGFGAEGIDDTEADKPSLPRWPYRHNDPGDRTP